MEALGMRRLEIGVMELRRFDLVVEDAGKGVKLTKVEDSTGGEMLPNHLAPAGKVSEPAQHACGAEHDVELLIQVMGQVIDIREHEAGIQIQLFRQ